MAVITFGPIKRLTKKNTYMESKSCPCGSTKNLYPSHNGYTRKDGTKKTYYKCRSCASKHVRKYIREKYSKTEKYKTYQREYQKGKYWEQKNNEGS